MHTKCWLALPLFRPSTPSTRLAVPVCLPSHMWSTTSCPCLPPSVLASYYLLARTPHLLYRTHGPRWPGACFHPFLKSAYISRQAVTTALFASFNVPPHPGPLKCGDICLGLVATIVQYSPCWRKAPSTGRPADSKLPYGMPARMPYMCLMLLTAHGYD